MTWLFKRLLDRFLAGSIQEGRFKVVWPDGSETLYGDGQGPPTGIKIHDAAALRHMALSPGLALGEAYMDGTVTITDGVIHDVLTVVMDNIDRHPMAILTWNAHLRRLLRPILQANDAIRARRNVAHHYDLNGHLYALFLDRDRQYSCAYFPRGIESLEEAQIAKKRHIAAKLLLNRPNLTVLDIGCGWGGLAITLARDFGAEVTGITLSEEQLAEARARAAAAGLSERVKFELLDYRFMNRPFDRIVSVGMFEHVGVPNFPSFFETVSRCLKPDGVALLHSIGRLKGPGSTNPWIAKYIFPGGYSPALSEALAPLEKSGLITTDIEILRLHYAKTIVHWRRRFAANRAAIAALYDERFCRMFEFYLSAAQLSFSHSDGMNFQIQMAHHREAVPLTRDYMYEQERHLTQLRAAE